MFSLFAHAVSHSRTAIRAPVRRRGLASLSSRAALRPLRVSAASPFAPQQQAARSLFTATKQACAVLPFNLADIGEGIAEVEIMTWFVEEGAEVSEFDEVCEVQSDKATVNITSRYTGKITKLHYEVGDLAKVGAPLIDIDVEGAEVAPEPEPELEPELEPEPEPASPEPEPTAPIVTPEPVAPVPLPTTSRAGGDKISKNDGRVLATPAVRRLATEHSVDLASVEGTGKAGRVTKADLLRIVSEVSAQTRAGTGVGVEEASSGQLASLVAAGSADEIPPPRDIAGLVTTENRDEPIRGIQRMMVTSMKEALKVPHFGYYDEIEMDAMIQLRKELTPHFKNQNVKLSYMPLMIKAASLALSEFPVLNAAVSSDEETLTYRGAHNICVAMDTPRGLLVPNVRNCEQRSIFDIAYELNRLQAMGAANKLGPDELQGGTFTLSNIGVIGGTYASPVLMPSQVAIGAIGKLQKLPRFDEDGDVVARTLMKISWSADHRVVDGATMARFSNKWKVSFRFTFRYFILLPSALVSLILYPFPTLTKLHAHTSPHYT
jgi:2-oxoisovalerate dehydrogenase E2 component (dihydrolipoyl transacylase)